MLITVRKKVPEKGGLTGPLAEPAAPAAEAAPLPAIADLMTINEVMKFAKVSDSTVRRWIRQQTLPVYRVGCQLRITRDDLIKFIHEQSK